MTKAIFYETASAWGSPGEGSPLGRTGKDEYSVIGIGYDATGEWLLADVCAGDGKSTFEGRAKTTGKLSEKLRSVDPKDRDSQIEKHTVQAYHNLMSGNTDPSDLTPVMEEYHSC